MECVPLPELVDLPEDNYKTRLAKLTERTRHGQEKLLVLKAKEEAEKRTPLAPLFGGSHGLET